MSEKKSWDVQPNRRQPASAPPVRQKKQEPPRRAPVRPKQVAAPTPQVVATSKRVKPLPQGTLRERRKKKQTMFRYVMLFLLVAIIAVLGYLLWRPSFRVTTVMAEGPDAVAAKTIAQANLTGRYFYIFPRNSILFYPKAHIRNAILDATPDASAVSITATSFSSISVTVTSRAKAFMWCGTSIDMPNENGSCYDADVEGFIFKQDAQTMSSSTSSTTEGVVRVFSVLDKDITGGQSPVRAHLASPALIPNAIKFVGAIQQLGVHVSSLSIMGDEASLLIPGNIRIRYVLGDEKNAASLAASVIPTLDLTSGTIQYIDFRFMGKAYIKRFEAASSDE